MQPEPSFDLKQRLIQVSLGQHGLLTRRQLEEHGQTRSSIGTLITKGELIRVRKGVYRSAFAPRTPEQRLHAACIGRKGTYASHRSAAELHGIRGASELIEVVTTADVRAVEGEVVHRKRSILPCDLTTVSGIPCTEVSRTLIDLGDVVTRDGLEETLDRALTKRSTSIPRIEWRLEKMPMKGSRGPALLRSILVERGSAPACESVLETKVLAMLKQAGLPLPIRQYQIELPTGGHFRADFAYPSLKLVIEAQGYKWHSGKGRWRRDLLRSSELALLGWRVVYLTWEDVTDNQIATIKRLRRVLTPQLWDPMHA